MKAVFFGTPEIASECLKRLVKTDAEVIYAVTAPDKPKGRGYKLESSEVKKTAIELGIPVYQPASLRTEETQAFLRSLGADVFITAAYGKIFPPEVLSIPPMGCVNVHASLLPRYRGASPINRAIMNGETLGGVTIMYMDEGMDTGDIILTKAAPIPYDMDFGAYYALVTSLGCDALEDYVNLAKSGKVSRIKQNNDLATYAPKVEKEETQIDFAKPAHAVYNLIRGLCPAPGAYTFLAGKRVKIYKAKLTHLNGQPYSKYCCADRANAFAELAVNDRISGEPGEILFADKRGICIACGVGSVVLTELQPEGKGRMSAQAFLAGNKVC
ncbi:MAG: methionyl-tRNA formyltransferase [Clostridia bacterium]|nr:methionyl-tRNA formyltransferase [Clostridia bacterium]